MISFRAFALIAIIAFTPLCAFSEAPVVDESENFALLDSQQSNAANPIEPQSSKYDDEEQPLAHESIDVNSRNSSNAMLLDKVQGLQQEIQELRGQLEVQAHDLKLLQQQQLAFYKDVDARLSNDVRNAKPGPLPIGTSATITPEKSVTSATFKPSHNPADEQISYLAAYELVKNKRFDEGLSAMQNFVSQYPQGGYTANAHYWLGELYMVKQSYPEAIEHFNTVLKQFPSSSKAAASMLKIGYALAASGQKQAAIESLQQVLKYYPDTSAAHLAKAKLEVLNS